MKNTVIIIALLTHGLIKSSIIKYRACGCKYKFGIIGILILLYLNNLGTCMRIVVNITLTRYLL